MECCSLPHELSLNFLAELPRYLVILTSTK
jgi:hypothetical protein